MQKLQMDVLLENISKALQEYAYNGKLESMHFAQDLLHHIALIDFWCFCRSIQIQIRRRNSLFSWRHIKDFQVVWKFIWKYFVLHARVTLHVHQQDKNNNLTGGQKVWVNICQINIAQVSFWKRNNWQSRGKNESTEI